MIAILIKVLAVLLMLFSAGCIAVVIWLCIVGWKTNKYLEEMENERNKWWI